MKFYTQYDRPDPKGFMLKCPEENTASQTYMPIKQMVEMQTKAGIMLQKYREENYHFPPTPVDEPEPEVPDDFVDLSTNKDIGIEDIQVLHAENQEKLEAIVTRQKEERERVEQATQDERTPDLDPSGEEE